MIEQLKEIYGGKKVFLTGHTGFKGSWLLKILNLLGAEVKGYALQPKTDSDLYHLINGDAICHSVIGDLREREKLIREITSYKPHFVFHLAAQPLVRLSYATPSETFEVNAIGTANVLDGIRELKGSCSAVMITTDKVYHNNEWLYPYRETDRLGGYDPYSASKACAELVIDSYRNSFFNPHTYDTHKKGIAVARAGNVIGGGDWSTDRLVPDIIRSLSKRRCVEIRNPKAVRPWQHVLEPLIGYLLLGIKLHLDNQLYSQAYNFGPYTTDNLSVEEMVNLAIRSWGEGDYMVNQRENQLHEAGLLKLDIHKTISEIGWKPRMNANESVEITIEWYKNFFSNKLMMSTFTEQQILQYING